MVVHEPMEKNKNYYFEEPGKKMYIWCEILFWNGDSMLQIYKWRSRDFLGPKVKYM